MEILPSQSSIERTDSAKDDQRIHTFNFQGYKIYVGRNALSNERLITEHREMHKKCIWLHVYKAKGAHVVICLGEKSGPPLDIVLRRATDLAIWFSVGKRENKKVVWSELQDVYKPVEGVIGVWQTYKQANIIEL
jgi:predicted ribosome quality control (RQC) complex YloA/Tae2 family protein